MVDMDDDWKNDIPTPALVLNYDIMQENIEKMADFVREHNVNHRPHVKTHKCPIIGHMQLKAGCGGVSVAKVGEAEVFAQCGFEDILIANQVIDTTHIDRLAKLSKYIQIRCVVDSKKNISDLNKISARNNTKIEVLLDVDLGIGRTGVENGDIALEIANFIKKSENVSLVGLMGWEGQFTHMVHSEQKEKMCNESFQKIIDIRDILYDNGFDFNYISTSGSSTYMYAAKYDGITEIRPGTYVFSDHHLHRVNPLFRCAVTILGTIQNQMGKFFTADAGQKAIAIEDGNPELKGFPKFKIRTMTEEHTNFKVIGFNGFEIGQKIEFIPAHVCITLNLYDYIHVVKNNEYIGKWKIYARGKNY